MTPDQNESTTRFSRSGDLRIVADDRERGGGVIAELQARSDVVLEITRLGVGDYHVGESIVVERKTVRDFAVSIVDTRLFKQAGAMVAGPRPGVIMLEGSAAAANEVGVSREALQGALLTVSVFYGLPILRSRDAAETARLLVYLGRQAQRCAQGGLPRPGYRPKGKRARQLFVLQGLPGIGPGRAERLLARFGSVAEVVNASAAALASADGIGPTIASRIRWALD